MKNFFCTILFMGVLCFGFSTYSQNQNTEWKTCLETLGGWFSGGECIEHPIQSIIGVKYDGNTVDVTLEMIRFRCLINNWIDGRHCSTNDQ